MEHPAGLEPAIAELQSDVLATWLWVHKKGFSQQEKRLSKLSFYGAHVGACWWRLRKLISGRSDRTRTRVILLPKQAPDQLGYTPKFQLFGAVSWTRAFHSIVGKAHAIT